MYTYISRREIWYNENICNRDTLHWYYLFEEMDLYFVNVFSYITLRETYF